VPDAELDAFLDAVVSVLRDHLGPELVGAYLHGSLAMDAFTPGRSDIDVLAVCLVPIPPERSNALGAALASIPAPASTSGLEFSLITEAAARMPSGAPAFEVHVSHEEPFVRDGHDRDGDEDLPLHFAMTRARGQTLVGPGAADVFFAPERALLVRSMRFDVETARREGVAWWEGHHHPELASMAYQVLNAARCLRYLETGELGSKVEGAAWLARRNPELHAILDAAVAYQQGGEPEPPDDALVDAFVERVESALRAAEG
jgi:hypothetical protein